MRKQIMLNDSMMFIVSFALGVLLFYFFYDQSMDTFIEAIDGRLSLQIEPSWWRAALPVFLGMCIVIIFATHPYFFFLAKWCIAMKICYFGFSSIYLLAEKSELMAYSVWWFPFQLIYNVLLIVLYELLLFAGNGQMRVLQSVRAITVFTAVMSGIIMGEIVIFSSIGQTS